MNEEIEMADEDEHLNAVALHPAMPNLPRRWGDVPMRGPRCGPTCDVIREKATVRYSAALM